MVMTHQKTPHVIVVGATGRLGAACVYEFAKAGWRVSAVARHATVAKHSANQNVEWITADVGDIAATGSSISNADVLIYAANPPYTQWRGKALSMAKSALDLAQAKNATFFFPGNVYNFGESMPPVLTEQTPQSPNTVKGQIRCEIEHEISTRTAHGLRAVTLRAGDFFGGGSGSWFDLFIAKSIYRGKLIYPGPLDTKHAWAYLPDLARTFVALANAQLAQPFTAHAVFHFAGHSVTGNEFLDMIESVARSRGNVPDRPLARGKMPWGFYRLLKHFVPILREVVEMEYLWRVPHSLDDTKLKRVIGEVIHTPLNVAFAAALDTLPVRR
jgi:nucleoside-diphosphate-sugar epimerase